MRRVYAYVAYFIGEGPEAEDVVGDVFERALRYRGSYDARLGAPAAWLIGIARRVLAEHRSRPVASPLEATYDPAAPGELELEIVQRLSLRSAMARLSDGDRELLALRYGADLSARQIGHVVEMRTNAVEVALSRALRRLRVLVEQSERAGNPLSRGERRTSGEPG